LAKWSVALAPGTGKRVVDVVYAEEQLDSVRWIRAEHERLTPTQDERLMGLEKWLAALIGEEA